MQIGRITTEEKANVVAAVWATELIKFSAAPDIFNQNDFVEKDEQNKGEAMVLSGMDALKKG